jgi:hypothetical protein
LPTTKTIGAEQAKAHAVQHTTHFHGNVGNVAQNSERFTQNANGGIQANDLARLVSELTEHLEELKLDSRQRQRAEAQIVTLKAELAQARGLSPLVSRYGWQTFRKDLPNPFLVPASKAPRLQMNFDLPSLPRQVTHSPHIAAVIRHSTFQTCRTARQMPGAGPEDDTVCRFLCTFQD